MAHIKGILMQAQNERQGCAVDTHQNQDKVLKESFAVRQGALCMGK